MACWTASLPTAGPKPISLPTVSPNGYYQAYGGDGLWRTESGSVRRYDATGHPVGTWHPYPHGFELGGLAATADGIASVIATGAFEAASPRPVLWYPTTGRIVQFGDPCFGNATSAPHTFV